MRTISFVALLTIIFALTVAFWLHILNQLFTPLDSQLTAILFSSFLGAFFAFLFIRVADFLRAYNDRSLKNYNSLVRLDHKLNSLLVALQDITHAIEGFEASYARFKSNTQDGHMLIWTQKLPTLDQLDDLIIDLTNIDLINELFVFNIHLRKLNQSSNTIVLSYFELKDAFLDKKISPENYLNGLTQLYDNLRQLKLFISSSIAESINLIAAIKTMAETRPLINILYRCLPGFRYSKKFHKMREINLQKIKADMEKVQTAEQERINALLRKK